MPNNQNSMIPEFGLENFTSEEVDILLNFTILWLEIVSWTRNLIHSVLGNLQEQSSVGTQLFLRLPIDFYNEFRKYYSEEESQEFLEIISSLISDNWQLTNAYKNNDPESINLAKDQLYKTSDRLAEFLSRINPYYNPNEFKTLLYNYIELKNEEISALISGDYKSEVNIYNEIEQKAILIGKYMALGIIAMRRTAQSKLHQSSRTN